MVNLISEAWWGIFCSTQRVIFWLKGAHSWSFICLLYQSNWLLCSQMTWQDLAHSRKTSQLFQANSHWGQRECIRSKKCLPMIAWLTDTDGRRVLHCDISLADLHNRTDSVSVDSWVCIELSIMTGQLVSVASVLRVCHLLEKLLLATFSVAWDTKKRKKEITTKQTNKKPMALQLFLSKNWRCSCTSKLWTIDVVAGLAPLAEIEDGEIVFDASGNQLVDCSPDSSLNGKPHLML